MPDNMLIAVFNLVIGNERYAFLLLFCFFFFYLFPPPKKDLSNNDSYIQQV